MSNVVMVKKKSEKWCMWIDFTDLDKVCRKDPYPLQPIDKLIDGASRFCMLSFIDAYSSYNQIRMNLVDAPKMIFVTDINNYYYEVMSFGLKNSGATY